jgi:two-component system sensor histidine kinase RegB
MVLVGLLITCAVSFWYLNLSLQYKALVVILSGLCFINAFTLARLKKPWPVTDTEFFGQLQLDIASIALLLYFSGGASNPFISYLLVPICIGAATLKPFPSRIIALTAAILYSLLLFYNYPIPALSPHHAHGSHTQNPINLHVIGMWLNFGISTLLVTYFVTDMAKALRQREELLHKQSEDRLRDEQLLAVATLAAGTAHELGTPLATMKVLLHEMEDDYCGKNSSEQALHSDLKILSMQVEQCSDTLKQLVNQAEKDKDGSTIAQPVQAFCETIIERWLLLNPKVTSRVVFNPAHANTKACIPATVAQSILSLLNNAADACPDNICVDIRIDEVQLSWTILDNGPGIAVDLMDKLGTPFLTNKQKGFGLGLFLSHTTLNRYNGSIQLFNRDAGGTRTELILPINEVTP